MATRASFQPVITFGLTFVVIIAPIKAKGGGRRTERKDMAIHLSIQQTRIGMAFLALTCLAPFYTYFSATGAGTPNATAGCIDIRRYGADGQGNHDTASAFQAAVRASGPDAICVYFPAGRYRFSNSPTVSLGSGTHHLAAAITIQGDGAGLSRLQFDPGVSGPALRLNGPQQSFHIRDLSILAGGKNTDATGLSVIQEGPSPPNPAQSDITGVSIHGIDGYGADDRFDRGIYLHQVSNVNLANTVIAGSPDKAPYASSGTCLHIDGSATSIPVQINIIGSQINFCGHGIHYGPYLQGLQIVGSNFVGNGTAIYQPVGNQGNDQLSVVGSQFNSGTRNITLNAPIDGVIISASDFYLAETGSASLEMPGVQFVVQGNTFIQLGTPRATAIAIGPFLLDAGIITGNNFKNFNTAVLLQPRSSHVNVQSNSYSDIKSEKVVDRGNGNTIGGGSI